MDISFCNEAQRTVIETLPGPLFVAAGAGSGKTFTLKLRTANAFLGTADGFKLDSIDQVLAITFTDKAAAELLERIRNALAEEGLHDQAFAADAAWISTIHGFCSRFLRENALEIGLDPEFRLATEYEMEMLAAQAQAFVLEQVRAGALDTHVPVGKQRIVRVGNYGHGLLDDALALIERASALPDGLASLRMLESDVHPKEDLETLKGSAEAVIQAAQCWEKQPNKRTEAPALERLGEALLKADAWLNSDQASLLFSDRAFDANAFREMLHAFPVLTPSFGKGKGTDDAIEAYRRVHTRALSELDAALGMYVTHEIYELACAYEQEFMRLKAQAGVVDNDDLLRLTLRALQEHPHLAARCQEQFRLIMVDEFQDTNKMQIRIIRLIAQPNLANVCVVGDAQQSIYRFRGADVAAFTEYRDALVRSFPAVEEARLQPKLAENFRSHADILAFVDAVFSQGCSFGEDYLQLSPCGSINKEPDAVMDVMPRVSVDVTHCKNRRDQSQEARRQAAQRIAQHFAQIKHAYDQVPNAPRQSFALLLGTTGNAQVYIDALREAGLESMMTAGSILLGSDEAKTLQALLRYAVNTNDDQALLDCLTSSLFAVSDDALLALSHFCGADGGLHHGSLAKAFRSGRNLMDSGLPHAQMAPVERAHHVLMRFVRDARSGALSEGVRRVLVSSGALDRAQDAGVSGFAQVGNWSKLLGILEDVEGEEGGLASRIAAFEAKAQRAKESPGVLSAEEADFVQILTIHGSKGLEFDHVAVAEFKTGMEAPSQFLAEHDGEELYALSTRNLSLPRTMDAVADALAQEAGVRNPRDARFPGQLRSVLTRAARGEALAEARRLLYVGLTRAVKSLYLSYVANKAPALKGAEPYSNHGIMREVYGALQWDVEVTGLKDANAYIYGGSRPAQMVFNQYDSLESMRSQEQTVEGELIARATANDAGSQDVFLIPVRELPDAPYVTGFSGVRADVCSYTSLSAERGHASTLTADASFEWDDLAHEIGEDATNLGTAFHRLAQKAILARNASGAGSLAAPSAAEVDIQAEKLGITEAQRERLDRALRAWFASPVATELCRCEQLDAEVPFMVTFTDQDGREKYLEGEIDALGVQGDVAFLVDYKTGGHAEETQELLYEKHLLQAQCYAYALKQAGFASVRATFVRVEQLDPNGIPQTVTYTF